MALITPTLIDEIGGYLFIIFGGCCFACGVFSLFVVKETKGLSNAEVANLYVKGKTYLNLKEATEDTDHDD
jgi:Sugar (and other) transporter